MIRSLISKLLKSIVLKTVEIIEANKPDEPDRLILPMSGGANILPNKSAQITARPQNHDFVAERIVLSNPKDWVINDIRVGNTSQFVQSGDIPGEMFSFSALHNFVKFNRCPIGADFTVVATYIGNSEKGEQFVCGVLGSAIPQAARRTIRPNLRVVA